MLKQIIAAVTLSLVVCGARAEDTQKGIDFTQQLTGQDGKPLTQCVKFNDEQKKCDQYEPLTLGMLCSAVLSKHPVDARGMPVDIPLDEQTKRGLLAIKIKEDKSAILKAEDVVEIKQALGKAGLNAIDLVNILRLVDPAGVK